jgi:Tol biopolymer transport system component
MRTIKVFSRNQGPVQGNPTWLLIVWLATWTAIGQTDSGSEKLVTRTTSLGKVPLATGAASPAVSQDNRHIAFPVMRGGKWCVTLDGVPGKPYAKVAGLRFSPDGKRLAFVATKDSQREVVVVNGEEGKDFGMADSQSLLFSPDSQRLAYVAGAPDSVKQFVVLDGKEGSEFDMMCGGGAGRVLLFFSPDSQQLAYGGARKTGEGHFVSSVVVEGRERKGYELKPDVVPILKGFSPDSRRLAWLQYGEGKGQMVVDGKPDKEFDTVSHYFAFSPDGKRTAYFAQRAGKWMAVVDGQERAGFKALGDAPPLFSPDSRRLAYIAKRGDKDLVMLEGKEGAEYDGVGSRSLRFSPDSQHFAYMAHQGEKHFVVRDGQEGKAYDRLHAAIFFSPDSRHLAYFIQQGEHSRLVLDDKEYDEYEGLADNWHCFSPDSVHLAYGAVRGGKLVLVLDGREVGDYQGNLGTLAFDGPRLLRGIVSRIAENFAWEFARLEVEITP